MLRLCGRNGEKDDIFKKLGCIDGYDPAQNDYKTAGWHYVDYIFTRIPRDMIIGTYRGTSF